MEQNPCETCNKHCAYRLFIDCPDWCEWASEVNAAQESLEEDGG